MILKIFTFLFFLKNIQKRIVQIAGSLSNQLHLILHLRDLAIRNNVFLLILFHFIPAPILLERFFNCFYFHSNIVKVIFLVFLLYFVQFVHYYEMFFLILSIYLKIVNVVGLFI